MDGNLKLPNVLHYLDLSSYLKGYYQYRKATSEGFSYDRWIVELDIKLSRVFLRLAVLGIKRVPRHFVEAFSDRTLATRQEKDYFLLLVRHSQARTQEEKQMYSQKLIQILRADIQYSVIEGHSEFVLTPLFLRMLTLLSFKDVRYDSETISLLLGIPATETQQTLRKMQELRLVESVSEEGRSCWRACHTNNEVAPQLGDRNLMKFHEKSLMDAIEAFHQPKNLRRYDSLFLALSEEELALFYKRLDDFVDEQGGRFDSDRYEGRRLFQMNFNIHAVAKPVSEIVNTVSEGLELGVGI